MRYSLIQHKNRFSFLLRMKSFASALTPLNSGWAKLTWKFKLYSLIITKEKLNLVDIQGFVEMLRSVEILNFVEILIGSNF